MIDFEVNGKKYQATKLDAFTQFHVVRRLGPLYPYVVSALAIMGKDPLTAISNITLAMSRLSDDDANFVMKTCLGVTKVNQGTAWASLLSPQGTPMFQDMEMQEMLQVVWKVLESHFGPFMQGLSGMISGMAPSMSNSSVPLKE